MNYRRDASELALTIRTDWDTVEDVLLRFTAGEDPRSHFLLRGEPYGERSLDEIEESPGKLKPEMRVTAWVCESGPQPVLDWRPPEKH